MNGVSYHISNGSPKFYRSSSRTNIGLCKSVRANIGAVMHHITLMYKLKTIFFFPLIINKYYFKVLMSRVVQNQTFNVINIFIPTSYHLLYNTLSIYKYIYIKNK